MKLKPIIRYAAPAYPMLAALAASAAVSSSAGKPAPLRGVPVRPPMPPVYKKDVTVEAGQTVLVSVKALRDVLGVKVSNAPNSRRWNLGYGRRTITVMLGGMRAVAGNRTIRLAVPPRQIGTQVYVPARAVADALGLKVSKRDRNMALSTPDAQRMLVLVVSPPKETPPIMGTLPGIPPRSR